MKEKISDELLAAYLDGNLSSDESSFVEEVINSDFLLSESVDIVKDADLFADAEYALDFFDDDAISFAGHDLSSSIVDDSVNIGYEAHIIDDTLINGFEQDDGQQSAILSDESLLSDNFDDYAGFDDLAY